MNPGLSASFRGKSNVLVTHPLNLDTPCTLSRTVDVPPGKQTVLAVVVSHHPRGNWNLKLKVNGQQKDETKPISTKTCPDGWCRIEFDLSVWSGQTVKLELLNEASGWNFEAGYWNEIKIDSMAAARNTLN